MAPPTGEATHLQIKMIHLVVTCFFKKLPCVLESCFSVFLLMFESFRPHYCLSSPIFLYLSIYLHPCDSCSVTSWLTSLAVVEFHLCAPPPTPPQGLVLISVCPPPCASFTQPSEPNSSGCNYRRPPWQKYCLDQEQVNNNNPGQQPVLWLSRIRPSHLSSSAVCPLCHPLPSSSPLLNSCFFFFFKDEHDVNLFWDGIVLSVCLLLGGVLGEDFLRSTLSHFSGCAVLL